MRRRHALPPALAEIVSSARPGLPTPLVFRFRDDGARLKATEERPDKVCLVVARSGDETCSEISFAMADTLAGDLPTTWRGHCHRFRLEGEGEGDALSAAVLCGEGAAVLEYEPCPGMAPPAWVRCLPDVTGADAYRHLAVPAEVAVPDGAAEALADLVDSRRQWALVMEAMSGDHVDHDPWPLVRGAARDLGMALSTDKANVRTALAPIVAGPDAEGFLAGLSPQESSILTADGLFILRDGDGRPLGHVPWDAASGFEPSVALLGPGAPLPAALGGAAARDLAREGYHAAADGTRLGLWSLDALDGVRPVLAGLAPHVLDEMSRRED